MDSTVTEFSELTRGIASPALQAVAEHWERARSNKPMPAWSDLSPSNLAPYLKLLWSFKYDRETGEFTARLAGNRVMLGFGRSFRGTPLRELHPAHVFVLAQADMTRAVSEPAIYRCSGKLFKIGDQIVEGERIVFPLASDGYTGDGVLGASDFNGPLATGAVELLRDKVVWFTIGR